MVEDDDAARPAALPSQLGDSDAWAVGPDGQLTPLSPGEDLRADVELLRQDVREVRRISQTARAEGQRIREVSQRQRRRLASPLRLVWSNPD